LHGIIESLINGVTHVIDMFGYFGVFVWMLLESACIPIPSEAIMPFAGMQIAKGRFDLHALAFVGAFANLVGSVLAYWVGSVGGRPFIAKYGKYILIRKHDVDMADRWFDKHGDATVFWTRMMPIIRTFISLPAGISKMNFPKFCVYTFIGAIPWCYLLTYAGMKLGDNWDTVSVWLHKADAVILVVLIVVFIWWIKRHLTPDAAEETEEVSPEPAVK
jgi:membrane protein DedA with SNARE-associated domain